MMDKQLKFSALPTFNQDKNETYMEYTPYIAEGEGLFRGYRRVKVDGLGFYIIINKRKVYFK